MGFFDFFHGPDINRGVEAYRSAPGAVLLDVRTPEEYRQGHIPGSKNLPLHALEGAGALIEDQDSPVYVYCQSGARSRQAAAILGRMGYQQVTNLGGISAWRGKVER